MVDARDVWNERYRSHPDMYGAGPNEFVVAHLSQLSAMRVLDLGCGQGRNAVWLAAQGHAVTALDLSDVAIEQARERAAAAEVDVDLASIDIARAWRPEPVFDLVVMSYFQLPGDTRRAAHRKAIRALAPGGRIFLIAHHADNLEHGVGGPPMPEVMFDEEDLAADFGELDIVRNQKVFRDVEIDGTIHRAHDILFEATRPARAEDSPA